MEQRLAYLSAVDKFSQRPPVEILFLPFFFLQALTKIATRLELEISQGRRRGQTEAQYVARSGSKASPVALTTSNFL